MLTNEGVVGVKCVSKLKVCGLMGRSQSEQKYVNLGAIFRLYSLIIIVPWSIESPWLRII